MSSSLSPRPLSLVPFIAADAGLLLTAALIAWRTPEELTGAALFGVVFCMGLGAVLAVLPFVLNDAREREAALAERQRELTELVTTSTATASRWGAQWASAATGLEDAATLASRSIAAAERLPAVFQEKADALAERLERADNEARIREETGARQEAALAACAERIGTTTAALQQVLAEFPAAVAQARAARVELDERVAAVTGQLETRIERMTLEAEARLVAAADALANRFAEVEASLGLLLVRCEQAAVVAEPVPAVVTPVEEQPVVAVVPEVVESAPVVMEVEVAAPAAAKTKPAPVSSDVIMDPFLIPDDGYAALAEAMDAGRA